MNDAENPGKVPSTMLSVREQHLPFSEYTRQVSQLSESLEVGRKSALEGVDLHGRDSVSNLFRLLIAASGRALGSLYANTGFVVEKANKEV